MNIHPIYSLIIAALFQQSLLAQYDALPLRSSLADEEYFQTSLGREGHRFAAALINQYTLYDFYDRQAAFYLKQPSIPELLPPYPGLQGGRQGHWGNTNERNFSAVKDRTVEAEYFRLIERREGQFIRTGDGTNKEKNAVCVFDATTSCMKKVILQAKLTTPVHTFSYQVDRFGFNMSATGKEYFLNSGNEWLDDTANPAVVSTIGYYVNSNNVIYRRNIAGIECLDMPMVEYNGEIPIYSRTFQWQADAPTMRFLMPEPAAGLIEKEAEISTAYKDGIFRIRLTGTVNSLIYEIQGAGEISVAQKNATTQASLPACKKGQTLRISCWLTKSENANQLTAKPIAALATLTRGGPTFFPKTTTVKGQLNADPAAHGSGYAMDDIPVPIHNAYGTPMTTSGLTFDDKGDSYISTLVGDIWKVSGLSGNLEQVVWKRFASGIPNPLGLKMVGDVLYVTAVGGIMKLHDFNHDGEADYYERFTKQNLQLGGQGQENQNLETDANSNFYLCGAAGIFRISADGAKVEKISDRARNSLGLGVRPDGLALSDSSEGNPGNGTCTIYESNHPENEKSVSKFKRILYLPRGIDNSPGSRIFLNNPAFGPLGQSIVGTSFGSGSIYAILRDPNQGTPQAAMIKLPMETSSGAARIALHPLTKEIFVVGFDGWGDLAVDEGCLHRIRYTGEKCLLPIAWRAYRNGISVSFNEPLDAAQIKSPQFFAQQWNYIDATHTYGSPEYSVRHPEMIGHDHLTILSTHLSEDKKELFLEIKDLLPAMCTQLSGHLKAINGAELKLNLFATLNQLNGNHPKGSPRANGPSFDLVSPLLESNGDTYTNLTNYFDKRAGRDLVKRPVAEEIVYKKEDLNYRWINDNLIQKQCIICHAPGTAHDFSNYQNIRKLVNLEAPSKSTILGMIHTNSMPPFPLPLVAPSMREAILEWIKAGAKE
jgi:hypothetical protein